EADESRGGREGFDERLAIEDLLADSAQRLGREIEQHAAIEALGAVPVDEPVEPYGPGLEGRDEAGGGRPRPPRRVGSDDDDDLVELAELPGILAKALDVRLSGRQEMQVRCLEREHGQRHRDGEHGERDREEHGHHRAPVTRVGHRAEDAARSEHHATATRGAPLLSIVASLNMPTSASSRRLFVVAFAWVLAVRSAVALAWPSRDCARDARQYNPAPPCRA